MKKALLLAGLLLALSAPLAMAAGVSVSWMNYCWGEEGSSTNLTWACNTNSNVNIRMTTSFKLDTAMPDFVGVAVYMEGMTEAAAVPDWWKLGATETGDCRSGQVSVSADGSILANAGADVCFDPWANVGGGGGGLGLYSWDSNLMHINAAWASAEQISLDAETEYFAVQFRVGAQKSTGTGSCEGCLTPAVWGLYQIVVATPTTETFLKDPYAGGNQCVTWQSSTLPCGAVPTRNTTWGQIKSLYR